jgi:hypothetical protein
MILILGAWLGAMCCSVSFTHDQSSDDPVDAPMLTLLSCQLPNDCVLMRVNFSRPLSIILVSWHDLDHISFYIPPVVEHNA